VINIYHIPQLLSHFSAVRLFPVRLYVKICREDEHVNLQYRQQLSYGFTRHHGQQLHSFRLLSDTNKSDRVCRAKIILLQTGHDAWLLAGSAGLSRVSCHLSIFSSIIDRDHTWERCDSHLQYRWLRIEDNNAISSFLFFCVCSKQ